MPEKRSIYMGRVIAAPMVRVSSLAFRVACAKQGADAMFSEELVAQKLSKSRRCFSHLYIPLTMLPIGYRVLTSDLIKSLSGDGDWRCIYNRNSDTVGNTQLTGEELSNNLWKKRDISAVDKKLIIERIQASLDLSIDSASGRHISTIISHFGEELLSPEAFLVPVPHVEYVTFEPFKSGFKKAHVTSFLVKTPLNPHPEGDRRPAGMRCSIQVPRSSHRECAQTIAQIGASEPSMAAAAASLIAEDVDGIDVNMGCPKAFSVQNGMGAALMSKPDVAGDILFAINAAVNSEEALSRRASAWPPVGAENASAGGDPHYIPVSFKTRVFDKMEASIRHLEEVLTRSRGMKHPRDPESELPPIHSISLHARTREQLSETPPLTQHAELIAAKLSESDVYKECQSPTLVFNGSVIGNADSTPSGFQGLMLARSAMFDPSVFNDRYFISDGGVASTAQHDPFVDFCRRYVPPPQGWSAEDWRRLRENMSSQEKTTMEALPDIFMWLLRHHAAFHTQFMYVKYHITRSLGDMPASKMTLQELSYLFSPHSVEDDAAEKLVESHTRRRGDVIFFSRLQSSKTLADLFEAFVSLKESVFKTTERRSDLDEFLFKKTVSEVIVEKIPEL